MPSILNKNKKIGVYGLGKSGISLCRFLQKFGYDFVAWDDYKNTNTQFHNKIIPIECWNFADISAVIVSPGIDISDGLLIVDKAKEYNVAILTDVALFYDLFKPKIVGITGTNGKSTVVSMLGHVFEYSQLPFAIGGNIGVPVFDLAIKPENDYIFELSSYQLNLIGNTRVSIGAILNIMPDHLDNHKTFENYLTAKFNMFKNQTNEDFAIINYDDKTLVNATKSIKLQSKKLFFSVKERLQNGYFVDGVEVFFAKNGIGQSLGVFSPKLISLGKHNIENIMAVLIVCHIRKLDLAKVIQALESFKNLEHRQEFVKKIDNVIFINDSKATNPPSTVKALENFENIYLILGGIAKTDNLDVIYESLDNVKKIYLIGQSKDLFFDLLHKKSNVQRCRNLEEATKKAFVDAKANDEDSFVLLSPACSSFDEFKNFEHRGRKFKKYVVGLVDNDE